MIYFSSDGHHGHANIIKFCSRPYKDVNEMNELLIHNWNSVVRPDDEVYYLGDFSLTRGVVERTAPRLLGKKYLIPGNHDHCHPAHKKGRKNLPEQVKFYENHGFTVLPIHYHMDIPEIGQVNLCHMPYKGDYTDERYTEYRMENDGNWLLCGHVHEKWFHKERMINVGVDVHDFKPVALEWLVEYMKKKANEKLCVTGLCKK